MPTALAPRAPSGKMMIALCGKRKRRRNVAADDRPRRLIHFLIAIDPPPGPKTVTLFR
jgi:hypothetical protein